VLPDGRGILFTLVPLNPAEPEQIAVLDLKTRQSKRLIRGTQPEYVPTGHLLYIDGGTLHGVRFDVARLEVAGEAVPVVNDVFNVSRAGDYAVSRGGTLVYVPASAAATPRSLVWVDRKGHEAPVRMPPRLYAEPRLSPDGTRVALTLRDQENDIWIWDIARETLTRLTFDRSVDENPIWTPDGRRIVFASARAGAFNLFAQAADGSGVVERLTGGADPHAGFVAPDGSGIVGSIIAPRTNGDIVWFPLGADRSKVVPLVQTMAIEYNPDVSPNGRFLAYQSNESGREEIYVRPFPGVNDGRWQVSTGGGTRPVWARNGRELFYVDLANMLTAVPVETSGSTFTAGNSAKLFEPPYEASLTAPRDYDVSPDGQRFLMIKENVGRDENPRRSGLVVVLNWLEELKQRVPTK
jgi:serine/threonine-protein kinase